ncbi:pyrroline-5-carboxylate reductase [Malaciobacter pacificus]|jgi:pyrroline-5-carboxylate reductase|uniref:Pyrroline-5-carboxylate reductase n=1 Tax=Malaciobacter pacificus TaxID=1080223 RepID=A0A5C2HBW9_9BACT|nr:pyrroline-5-carboxylate reductase [Malaciobacter pacificus]QEP33762.1 pyrroline-5-carboxylate reductase [Malaciobacter pacificus]GGD33105.1 pyrroline-5-carboxylate reductase [Malaciobacter pacificus]
MKLTLIGNGTMAQSLAKGLVANHEVEIIGRNINKLKEVQKTIPQISIKELDDVEDITGKNILFCVKPYVLQTVSARLSGKANILFSILAGTTLDSLKKHIEAKYYVRTMPNVAASVLKSMTTLTGDEEVKNEALEIFTSIGQTLWLESEKQLDIATAVAGSGPAFLALIAEGLTDGAVRAGLPRDLSSKLVQGLFTGTSTLLETQHPALIKDSVMSPGGTTAVGYGVLEKNGVRNAMMDTIEQTYNKAQELGKK